MPASGLRQPTAAERAVAFRASFEAAMLKYMVKHIGELEPQHKSASIGLARASALLQPGVVGVRFALRPTGEATLVRLELRSPDAEAAS